MENLIKLIGVLKPDEVNIVRHFYQRKAKIEDLKALRLFEAIKGNLVKTDGDAINLLFSKNKKTAYSQTKANLKKKILDALMMYNPEDVFKTPYEQTELLCQKLYLQSRILFRRNCLKIANVILNKSLQLSDKFELPNVAITILNLMADREGAKTGSSEYLRYHKLINTKLDLIREIGESKFLSNALVFPFYFTVKTNFEQKQIQGTLKTLKQKYKITNSANIGFYYYHSLIVVQHQYFEFRNSIQNCYNLIKLLIKEPAIHSKIRLGAVHMKLSLSYMGLKQYKSALREIIIGLDYIRKDSLTFLRSLEALFLIQFYSGNLTEARSVIIKAEAHPLYKNSEYSLGKWHYFKICLLFKTGNHLDALKEMNNLGKIKQDKLGWRLGYYLLEIACLFEMQRYYSLEMTLSNLEKHLQRQFDIPILEVLRKTDNLTLKRTIIIFLLIKAVIKNLPANYSGFKDVIYIKDRKTEQYAQQLLESELDHYWDPLGYEIIQFDKWFLSKFNLQYKLRLTSST